MAKKEFNSFMATSRIFTGRWLNTVDAVRNYAVPDKGPAMMIKIDMVFNAYFTRNVKVISMDLRDDKEAESAAIEQLTVSMSEPRAALEAYAEDYDLPLSQRIFTIRNKSADGELLDDALCAKYITELEEQLG